MPSANISSTADTRLSRVIGVPGAVLLGLGSIVGTGVFVSTGIAAGVAGPAVVLAVIVGGVLATVNGLSSAQLAAAYPISGGTYEYARRVFPERANLAFTAGIVFLLAKSASAATASLGFAGYLLHLAGVPGAAERVIVAVLITLTVTAVVAAGLRRSNRTNAVLLGVTLIALTVFVVGMLPAGIRNGTANLTPMWDNGDTWTNLRAFCEASALMFVAYTGYGRVATLGEEIRDPATNIPRAVVSTLIITSLLYTFVTVAAVAAAGAAEFAASTTGNAAPLEILARRLAPPEFAPLTAGIIAVGAVSALAGVLLNLVLGLSRVLLGMARRGDMPGALAQLSDDSRGEAQPHRAVWAVGVFIAGLTLAGDVKLTWSFSAFTVLVYYAITNLAALFLPQDARRYPRFVSAFGLIVCLGLAAFVDWRMMAAGAGVLVAALMFRSVFVRGGASPR